MLFVASEWDVHADYVIVALNELGFADVLRIDFETAGDRFDLTLDPAAGGGEIRSKDVRQRSCRLDDLRTVWWRRANSTLSREQLHRPRDSEVDRIEINWACRWAVESIAESLFPLGHPNRMRRAENKLMQLRAANAAGFKTPATIFTNDQGELLAFASRFENVVVKPLHTTSMQDAGTAASRAFRSRAISVARLRELCGEQAASVAYCQQRIDKVADIRVTVLPSLAVACRIATDDLDGDDVDWRQTALQRRHDIIELPSGLEAKCRRFLEALQLKWGAFDFALSDAGEWTFFECNPNGQWLWIEQKTGFPLSQCFAKEMLARHAAR